jgi:hypothetical protein
MSRGQYAQLTIRVDGRASQKDNRTILWHGPSQAADQDCSHSSQTVHELLTRFGTDRWELVSLQEHREGGWARRTGMLSAHLRSTPSKRPDPSPG